MDTITVDLKRSKRALIIRTILGWVCYLLTFGMYLFFYVYRIVNDNNILMALVVISAVILGLNLIATIRLPKCLRNALRSVSADGSVIIVNDDRYDMVGGAGFNVYDGPLKLRFLYGFSFVAVWTDAGGNPKSKAYWCGFWSDEYCRGKFAEIFDALGSKLNLIREAKWDRIGETLSTTPFVFSSQRKSLSKGRVHNALIGYGYAAIVLAVCVYEFCTAQVFLGIVMGIIALFFIIFVTFNQHLYSVNLKMLVHNVFLSDKEYKINGYSFALDSIQDVSVYMASNAKMSLKGNIETRPPQSSSDSGFYMEIVTSSGARSRYWLGTIVDSEVSQIMGSAEYVRKMIRNR
ncbi:MAG: hypothetical protein K6A80_08400 [Saccharofermentans sp.]|nr:hypothetical protein [Saccharofermentans sp.]